MSTKSSTGGEGGKTDEQFTSIPCYECGGRGFFVVPDNGTNLGEETCDVCNGDGQYLADEWGDRPE